MESHSSNPEVKGPCQTTGNVSAEYLTVTLGKLEEIRPPKLSPEGFVAGTWEVEADSSRENLAT